MTNAAWHSGEPHPTAKHLSPEEAAVLQAYSHKSWSRLAQNHKKHPTEVTTKLLTLWATIDT